jgi:hypothetical protein
MEVGSIALERTVPLIIDTVHNITIMNSQTYECEKNEVGEFTS